MHGCITPAVKLEGMPGAFRLHQVHRLWLWMCMKNRYRRTQLPYIRIEGAAVAFEVHNVSMVRSPRETR